MRFHSLTKISCQLSCCTHGRGKVKITVNGKRVVQTGNEKFRVKRYPFVVTSANSGNSNNNDGGGSTNFGPINNGKECSVVTPIDYNTKCETSCLAGMLVFWC